MKITKKQLKILFTCAVLIPIVVYITGASYANYQAINHVGVDQELLQQSKEECEDQRLGESENSYSQSALPRPCNVKGVNFSKFRSWIGSNVNPFTQDIVEWRKQEQMKYFGNLSLNIFLILISIAFLALVATSGQRFFKKQKEKTKKEDIKKDLEISILKEKLKNLEQEKENE